MAIGIGIWIDIYGSGFGAGSGGGGAADGTLDFSDADQSGLWALFEDI